MPDRFFVNLLLHYLQTLLAMSSATTEILKHVRTQANQTELLQFEIKHILSLIKLKDTSLNRKDKELANMHGTMEDRRKEILHLRLALKGNFLSLSVSQFTSY